jgi:hypothetical protein
MFGFNSKNRKIENLLRESRTDFGFDSRELKSRIMMAVNVRHLSKDDVKRLTWRPSTWPRYALGTSLAMLVVVATSGLAFAANESKPGEVLFPVQKFQNKVVLSLPLSTATKAEISTNIVAKRIKELDEIQKNPSKSSKVTVEIREAEESIAKAASFVPENESEDTNVEDLAHKLDDLSTQHQQTLQNLSAQTEDTELKATIEKSVQDITATKARLRARKKIQDSKDTSNNDKKDRNDSGQGKNSGSTKLKLRLNNEND